jgi:hypothetical protein
LRVKERKDLCAVCVTYYNLTSNQFTGLNAITVPGTLRDSLVLLAVVVEQQTELQPTQIMTDTGAWAVGSNGTEKAVKLRPLQGEPKPVVIASSAQDQGLVVPEMKKARQFIRRHGAA